jgi:mycothiol synthase
MSSSLPEGFRLRGAAKSDVDVAAAIVHAEETQLRGSSDWGAPEMSMFWRHADLDDGTWIVETIGGAPAAFAASLDRDEDTDCWAAVRPEFRDRGISTVLLGRVEDRARKRGASVLKAGMFAENAAARRLFERLRFCEARHYYLMRIDFDRQPDPPSWPSGIAPSTFRPEDARAFHAALGEAFAEEWGFHALPFEEWKRSRLEAPDTDTSLWFVARDGDQIAGVVRGDPKTHGGGWIGALGVRKPWRKRGLGLALLRHAFVEFHRRGEKHVGLGVDAENPTGATRLYERAGMRILTEDVVFQKELA